MSEIMEKNECHGIKSSKGRNKVEKIIFFETVVEKNNLLIKNEMACELESLGLSKTAILRQLNIKGGGV